MTAVARLYTLREAQDERWAPIMSELEARFRVGLANATQWAEMPGVHCAVCDTPLDHDAAYLVVMMPDDVEGGFGVSGAICIRCAQHPRPALQGHAERTALLLFEEAQGRA